MLLAFIPYVNLIFVVNWRATKELFQRGVWNRCYQNSSSDPSVKPKGQAMNGKDEIANGQNQTVSTSVAQSEHSEV